MEQEKERRLLSNKWRLRLYWFTDLVHRIGRMFC